MIPIRIRADAKVVLASERRMDLARGHPLFLQQCPVCDEYLGEYTIVLVFVGIHPKDRKDNGYTIGGTVAVHARCAGVPEIEPVHNLEQKPGISPEYRQALDGDRLRGDVRD